MRSRIPDLEPVHRKLVKECKGRTQQLRKRQGCFRWKPDGWFQVELRPNIFWVLYPQQTRWWVWIMHPSKSREELKEPKGSFIIVFHHSFVSILSFYNSLVPQSKWPLGDLSMTDFDCELCNHCNCFFHYRYCHCLVSDQSPTDPRTFSNHLTFSQQLIVTGWQSVRDWSRTGWIMFYQQF